MLSIDDLKQLRKIIQEETESLKQGQKSLEQGQSQLFTAVKALGAGLHDVIVEVNSIRKDMAHLATKKDVDTAIDAAKKELKADILLLDAKITRKLQSHERRIDNIERSTNTPNVDKH